MSRKLTRVLSSLLSLSLSLSLSLCLAGHLPACKAVGQGAAEARQPEHSDCALGQQVRPELEAQGGARGASLNVYRSSRRACARRRRPCMHTCPARSACVWLCGVHEPLLGSLASAAVLGLVRRQRPSRLVSEHPRLRPRTSEQLHPNRLRLQEAESYANDNGIFFMETSAKTATNVNELFVAIARKLPKNTPQPRPGGQGLVINNDTAPGKKGCC